MTNLISKGKSNERDITTVSFFTACAKLGHPTRLLLTGF